MSQFQPLNNRKNITTCFISLVHWFVVLFLQKLLRNVVKGTLKIEHGIYLRTNLLSVQNIIQFPLNSNSSCDYIYTISLSFINKQYKSPERKQFNGCKSGDLGDLHHIVRPIKFSLILSQGRTLD